MVFLKLLICLCLATAILAEVVDFHTCPNDPGNCVINEVRVTPCPQADSHTACQLRRRKPTEMSFDFTPNFDADSLDATLVWVKDANQELPLATLEKDACKATTCPLKQNEKRTYTIDVPIESKFPLNTYTIKWTFTAPNGKTCCFTNDIKLVR